MGLEEYREEIDSIDRQIIHLLEKRFHIIEDIARLKRMEGQDIFDGHREREVRENWRAALEGMDREFVDKLVDLILQESKRVQERIR
jgi:chorismate mutase